MNSYTHTVVITIGRNVGNKPMATDEWLSFKASVREALCRYGNALILQSPSMGRMRAHDQVGEWEGKVEPAATFVALISGHENIRELRKELEFLTMVFCQDAIGCIVTLGVDHLIHREHQC